MYDISRGQTANKTLRQIALSQLKGKWGKAILACLIFSVLVAISGVIPFFGAIISIILVGPFTVGLCSFFLKYQRGEDVGIDEIFSGFRNFGTNCIAGILVSIYTFLWTLLFIIPGIIAEFKYSQTFFILAENPELTASEAIDRSKAIMNGYKAKLFILNLSFIGWALLSVLTFSIGYLWLIPYMQLSITNFYIDTKFKVIVDDNSNIENTTGTNFTPNSSGNELFKEIK